MRTIVVDYFLCMFENVENICALLFLIASYVFVIISHVFSNMSILRSVLENNKTRCAKTLRKISIDF